MIHLGENRNIVNLLGACTRGKRLMVIMEYAPHGSLLSFLRARRDIYEAKWTKTTQDPVKEWTLADMVMSAYQVSRGLEFLASKKVCYQHNVASNIAWVRTGCLARLQYVYSTRLSLCLSVCLSVCPHVYTNVYECTVFVCLYW